MCYACCVWNFYRLPSNNTRLHYLYYQGQLMYYFCAGLICNKYNTRIATEQEKSFIYVYKYIYMKNEENIDDIFVSYFS